MKPQPGSTCFNVSSVDLTENALTVARQFAARREAGIDFRLGAGYGRGSGALVAKQAPPVARQAPPERPTP